MIIHNFIFLEIFHVFESYKTSFQENNKNQIFIDKLPFTLHLLVGLMHNSTTTKEQKNGPVNALKKKRQILFCYFWNRIFFKVDDFLFYKHISQL